MIGLVEVGDGHGDRGINWPGFDLGVLAAKDSELGDCQYRLLFAVVLVDATYKNRHDI